VHCEYTYCNSLAIHSERRHGSTTVEYQVMPSLRYIAHDGVLCTVHAVSNGSAPDRGKWCGPSGQAAWTVHFKYKKTPCWVTSSSKPDGQPCWASPLVFGLIARTQLSIPTFLPSPLTKTEGNNAKFGLQRRRLQQFSS
jgi:hypothetical protein